MLGLLSALPCLLLLSLPGISSGSDDDSTVVLTTSGPIRGKRLQAGSGTVTAFLGIPYAEPPVGALRFQKPLPHQPWSHVLETTGFGNVCHQPPLTGYPDAETWTPKRPQSEDCLFLNIWVPHPRPPAPAPIIVWIHGGGFYSGAASVDVYDGRFLATTGNAIVASMNYRLGALGFLSLPPATPGNAGLWDQRLALHWLRDNAATFGGDPARFLLFGHGSGAASVGFHLLSPGSRPLFTRAAMQSGAPTAPWAWISLKEAQERGRRLGHLLGCTDSDDTALVGCLQGKEAGEFPKHEFSILHHRELLGFPFVPTPDGDFLPDTPPRLLQAEHGQPMPIMAGFNTNEGSHMLIFGAPSLNLKNASNVGWEELLQVVRLTVPGAPEEAVWAVAQRYSKEGERHGKARYRWAMDQIAGDYLFVCPVAEVAGREAEANSSVYAYYFTHRRSSLSTPEWTGVPHGSELRYLFGTLASVGKANHTHTEAEAAMSQRMMQSCGKFVSSGNPTGIGGSGKQWHPYDPTKQNFFRIGLEPPQVKETSPAHRCSFLASLLTRKPSPTGEHQRAERTAALEGKGLVSPHRSEPANPHYPWGWIGAGAP
ncbi:acetylcholinesterase-like [Emys orbicularis]|uniref:acetylcholinesterase-like n=1 Tax=Emys orbicularis TaxID=82168 RepID=UPI0031FD1CC7